MHDRALAALCRVTSELASDAELDTRVQAATDLAVEALGADHGSVRVCRANASLTPIARSGVGAGTPPTPLRKGQGLLGWAVKTGQAVRVADAPTDARFEAPEPSSFAIRSLISIPLMADSRALGVFSVSKAEPGAFDVSHELAATALGHCIGASLQIAELKRQATTDSMTGALNRAGLLPTLHAQMNRARRDGTPLSVLLMDLDHFKTVNDRFGHAIGDAMLSTFAQTVRDTVRDFDILIRRGGEEFELVMPTTSASGGLEVAERIRDRLARAPLWFGKTVQLQQTVSIGVATWDGTEDARSLDHRADLAMYMAKGEGRNRVCLAPSPAKTPTPRLVHAG
ncbi:MAG: diguanylate cyclase [Nannocystaceae bacterium]|nr:sensor domain-containing diguanylate cyclase [bacterium]